MVIDKLENIEKYASLNPLFAQAIEFLKSTDLSAHEIGKNVLKEGELMVNFAQAKNGSITNCSVWAQAVWPTCFFLTLLAKRLNSFN